MSLSITRFCAGLFLMAVLSGQALAQFVVPVGATFNVPAGSTLNLGCSALDVQGTFNLNSGQVASAGNVTIAASGTVNGQGTISVGGNWTNSGNFAPSSGTVTFLDGCNAGPTVIAGNTIFNNLTLTSSNGRTFTLPAGSNITVNGILTLQGVAGQPISIVSSSGQPVIINLGATATVVSSFANIASNVQIGAALPTRTTAVPTLSNLSLAILAMLLAAMGLLRGDLFPSRLTGNKTR